MATLFVGVFLAGVVESAVPAGSVDVAALFSAAVVRLPGADFFADVAIGRLPPAFVGD
ncbi:hypothetical protein [Kribbella flavida]|uniref:hypothetical protein n=1 Tax=Kribbella flavida TaxID=182640 RepID=UPI00192CB4A8|nr:hypothetical protein [Kribbella flavida]